LIFLAFSIPFSASAKVLFSFLSRKEIASIILDPHLETADADLTNNSFPRRPAKMQFQPFKPGPPPPNPMQQLERKAGPTAGPSPSP